MRHAVVAVATLLPLLLSTAARADDSPPIATASSQLADRVGQMATVELRVETVKHSPRRRLRFLNSASNFRSAENLSIVIDEKTYEAFRKADRHHLEATYLHKKIRARGQVIRDEGQPLVKVAGPADLEILDGDAAEKSAPAPAAITKLTVTNERGETQEYPLPLAGLPRKQIKTSIHGRNELYEGIAVSDLLKKAGVSLDEAGSKSDRVARYVTVTGADGYRAVLAIAEVDPHLTDQVVLLAERIDGALFSPTDGPLRLITPMDRRHRRWVRQVVKIEVHLAP